MGTIHVLSSLASHKAWEVFFSGILRATPWCSCCQLINFKRAEPRFELKIFTLPDGKPSSLPKVLFNDMVSICICFPDQHESTLEKPLHF